MEFRSLCARSDQRHFSFEYIPKLGQFVYSGFSQKFSDSGNARVVIGGPDRAGCFFSVLAHGAEFKYLENFTDLANPFLFIKNRTPGIDFDSEYNKRIKNQRYRAYGCGEYYIR